MTSKPTTPKDDTKKEPIVIYRQVEKETLMIEIVFNMLFEMLEDGSKITD